MTTEDKSGPYSRQKNATRSLRAERRMEEMPTPLIKNACPLHELVFHHGRQERSHQYDGVAAELVEGLRPRAGRRHGLPSEYIRRLIHADQKAHEEEDLERKILEGLNSPSREMTAKEWSTLRQGL